MPKTTGGMLYYAIDVKFMLEKSNGSTVKEG